MSTGVDGRTTVEGDGPLKRTMGHRVVVRRARREVPEGRGRRALHDKAFGRPFVTFMVAFAVMCSGVASASTAARAFGGDYLAEFFSAPIVLVALLFLTVIAIGNFRGVGESVKANVVLTLIEVTGLVVIIAIGLTAVLR